jgi:hypothetical protein
VGRGESDVVEQAKSHRTVSLGVVSGRTHEGEAVVDPPGHDGVDERQHTPRGATCRRE